MKNKIPSKETKAVTEIVGSILLLLVLAAVGSFVYMWGVNQAEKNVAEYAVVQKSHISMDFYDSNTLYVKSKSDIKFNYTKLIISGNDCGITGTIDSNNVTTINLDFCTSGLGSGPQEIILYSDKGVFRQMKNLYEAITGSLLVYYSNSNSCRTGYTKVFGLEYISNAHTETASSNNYPYSACIKHRNLTLTTQCSGTYDTVFYLDNQTNAHQFIDNSTPLFPISTWNEICIEADNATTIDILATTTDLSSSDYTCIASVEINNTYGGHVGNCNAYSGKIWVKIE